ncbi:hypothetical protein KBY91_15350 [Streptomyces sp. RK23]|uniref:hypothetical protein n=1 Tax=unclassified Streptomyces TaxID=2593676 RepID=UPI001B36B417|nr:MULTISPECIES: hypothetical protein [unclassified Streptomyces]MBQ0969204.1 hypothetical protein [Streptomyces sp. RK74B]MBQ1004785.1 hypothetical protein [Streptomyces sp. RK23]
MTHSVKAVLRVPPGKVPKAKKVRRPRSPWYDRLAIISLLALVVGLILSGIWHEDAYCHRKPDAGPNMRVDRSCYEVLAESSTWEAVMGKTGGWLILGSIVGFIVASWWFVWHHLRKR